MNDIIRYLKKIAALLIVLVMIFEFLPLSSFAANDVAEGEILEVRNMGTDTLNKESAEKVFAEGMKASGTLTSTFGVFTVTVENAPDGAVLSLSEATGYEELIQPLMEEEYLVYFALDISLGNIRPTEDITVTVEGDPINFTLKEELRKLSEDIPLPEIRLLSLSRPTVIIISRPLFLQNLHGM